MLANHDEIVEKAKHGEMRSISIASGILIIPKNFVFLNIGTRYSECEYVGVVANRMAEEMNIPHFFFFHNNRNCSDEFYKFVYKKLEKKYPRYTELRALESDLDPVKRPLSDDEYRVYWTTPAFGIFKIPHEKDLDYEIFKNPKYRVPYDAVIVDSLE